MRQPTILIYIEPGRGYYARWVGRTQERVYEGHGNVTAYWIEMLRITPEAWEPEMTPEAA